MAVANEEIIYDSGWLPLVLRIPCLMLAIVCLALLFDLVALRVVGRAVLLSDHIELPAGWLTAFLADGILAGFMLQVWVGRKLILWSAEKRTLSVKDRWPVGFTQRKFAHAELSAVQIRGGRTRTSIFWDILLRDQIGKQAWLTRTYDEADGRELGERIAATIDRPLERV